MKNIHIGPLPPPLGGISVYLYRLSRLNYSDTFIDSNDFSVFAFVKLIITSSNSHFLFHGVNIRRWMILYLCSFWKNKYSLVLHGDGIKNFYENTNEVIQWIIKCVLEKSNSIQAVNHQIKEFLCDVIKIQADKVFVQHAFLPPPLEDEERILKTYEPEVYDFINGHSPLVIANAFRLNFFNGVDLYGLDMCVKLVLDLKQQYPEVGLLFALADDSNQLYLQEIKEQLTQHNINDHFYFMTGQKELWPLFKKADLMVRPTCTDGDALSIREAMYFECRAVASDVCNRPEGTIVFVSRNQDDFNEKSKEAIRK